MPRKMGGHILSVLSGLADSSTAEFNIGHFSLGGLDDRICRGEREHSRIFHQLGGD